MSGSKEDLQIVMTRSERAELLKGLKKSVSEAGAFIRLHSGNVHESKIETKEQNSLVSFVDKGAEQMLVEQLSALLPEAGFITEEDTIENKRRDLTWIIDPLDGTTNFLKNIPMFSVSVALYAGNTPLIGTVYDVVHDEMFSAYKGGGAFVNGHQISVSPIPALADAIIATGFPYNTLNKMPELIEWVSRFLQHARGIRRLGSAALDLAYVASGRFDGFYESALNSWDVAAGALLVLEAGGQVSDFQGRSDFLSQGMILATNGSIHAEMQDLLN